MSNTHSPTPISYIVKELDEISALAKKGTEHEKHDGWKWGASGKTGKRDLRCICGEVLVKEN